MESIIDYIFIQYLNPEILSLYNVKKDKRYFNLCIEITKYVTLAVGSRILIPATYLSESEYIEDFVVATTPIINEGLLYRISPTQSLDDFVKMKTPTYKIGDNIREKYSNSDRIIYQEAIEKIIWQPRENSATRDIYDNWKTSVAAGDRIWVNLISDVKLANPFSSIDKLETVLYNAPDKLEGLAFIYRHISDFIPKDISRYSEMNIEFKLSRDYLYSYLSEYDAAIMFEFPHFLGLLDCTLPEFDANRNRRKLSYRRLKNAFDCVKLQDMTYLTFDEIINIRNNDVYKNAIDVILNSYFGDQILFLQISNALSKSRKKYKTPYDCVRNTLDAICTNIPKNYGGSKVEEKSKAEKMSITVSGGVAQINTAFDNAKVVATQYVGLDEQRLSELIGNVRNAIPADLPLDDVETVNVNLDVITDELAQSQPRKSFVKTALAGLKAIKGTAEFTVAVVALVQFVQTLL